MFKRLKSPKNLLIPFAVGMLLYFQNCAPPREFQSMSEEFSSYSMVETKSHEDPHIPIEDRADLETTYEPLLVDRKYLLDLFKDVFGPSATALASGNLIFADALEAGSLCSIYEDYLVKDAKNKLVNRNNYDVCSPNNPKLLQSQLIPKPTIKRQALINRYCSDLVATEATLNYALRRIESSTNETIPSPTEDNLRKLFYLFYRVHPEPQAGLLDALSLMFSDRNADKEEWKATILAVCTSSQWQVL